MPSHDHVAAEVARLVREYLGDSVRPDLLDDIDRLWRDAAAEIDLSRTQKPATWAAGLLYTWDRLQFGGLTQSDAAEAFGVSMPSVGPKFKQIVGTLGLVLLDARYLAEGLRAAARRDVPGLPDDLPLAEAPTSFRHFPHELRALVNRDDPYVEAQELVYDGWERVANGDAAGARKALQKALRLDPTLADAHNALAALTETPANAEALYRRAYALAREALMSEAPGSYHWWGELDTRPYMRARHGLGLALAAQGRYAEAVAEYEALLALNPNDNQGIRYLVGPTYLEAGDLDGALAAYGRYAADYPDDSGEPDHAFLHGLALWAAGRHADAARVWSRAVFGNLYVVPALLGLTAPTARIWHGTNLAEPAVAQEHVREYRTLWGRYPDARLGLGRLWAEPEVAARVTRSVELGHTMHRLSAAHRRGAAFDAARWSALVQERWALPAVALSDEAVRRIVAA